MNISDKSKPRTIKKIRNHNLLVEVENKDFAEDFIKMRTFPNEKCKDWPTR